MSFYRIYRPQVIGEIDNEHVRRELESLLRKDRSALPHAFLFSGPRGAGKTTAARIIAKIFNCEKPGSTGPCGKCPQCKAIESGTHLDVVEIDAASNRGIDEIRLLKERIGLAPSFGTYTVYIVDEVHMLTTEAFNALLKTLEEPPAHAVFVLATTELAKVPATIQSRCVKIQFTKAARAELIKAMQRIVKKESIKITADALELIAQQSDGSFRDSVKMLEQASLSGEEITPEDVRRKFAISDLQAVRQFLLALHDGNEAGALKTVEDLIRAGADMKTFLTAVTAHVTDSMTGMITEGRIESEEGLSVDDHRHLLRLLTQAFSDIKISPIPQLPLALVAVEFCSFRNKVPAPAVPPVSSSGRIAEPPVATPSRSAALADNDTGLITLTKLVECWPDVISELKSYNHSIAGVLRSTRPKNVSENRVTIEAFYKFHQEKLSEPRVKDALCVVFKKLFGKAVTVEIVLGKK